MRSLQHGDRRLGDAVRAVVRPWVEGVVINTTDLGSMYAVAGASAVLAVGGERRRALLLSLGGAGAWVAAQEAKKLFDRPRPYEADGVPRLIRPPTGSSFPSGHAAVATATGVLLAAEVDGRRGWRGWPLLGLWVPLTRISAGVHYPSDTVAGAAIGAVVAKSVLAASSVAVRRRSARG